jgi:hypothetical protein
MESKQTPEGERAYRVNLRISSCHVSLSNIYENIVDRDFDSARKDVKSIINEMKFILKALEDDDF